MNDNLIFAMQEFKKVFGDIVSLRELPQSISNQDIIETVHESIKKGINEFPMRFGYKRLEEDKNISM